MQKVKGSKKYDNVFNRGKMTAAGMSYCYLMLRRSEAG